MNTLTLSCGSALDQGSHHSNVPRDRKLFALGKY